MSTIKMDNDSNVKGNLYQVKTHSEKSMPNIEKTKYLQLTKLIEAEQIQNLSNFLKKDCPSPSLLNDAVIFLLKFYKKENTNFYEILHLLLLCGADVNLHIIISEKNAIKKEEKVTLLMFGIIHNDIKLINLILNFHPNLEQTDNLGRSAIIYAVIYDNHDSPDILNLLIKNNANINFSLNIQMSENDIEYHSVLTLSCFKDLVQTVKCLLINNVDTSFRTKPNGDTCLHLAVKYGSPELVGLLLKYNKINPEITNNNGKRAVDLIKEDDNEKRMESIFINYYKKISFNTSIINNQNQQQEQGGNYSPNIIPNNENMEYYSRMINNNGNNDKSHNNQFKQLQQLNQIQMNMNNGKKNNMANDRFNYPSPGIIGMMNNQMKSNNLMYNLNQNQNNTQDNNTMKEMNKGANLHNNDEINNNEEMFNEPLNIDSSNYPDKAFNQAQSKMMNNKNINQNINHMNSYQINLLKNNLFNKFNNKPKMDYGIEIPVELMKNNESNSNQNLGKFMKQNNIPIINLDLTNNKILELEYKIIELKEKIKEKNKSVLNLEKELRINDEKIKKNSKELKGKEEEFEYYSLVNNQHKEEIIKLNNIKMELIGKIPPDQISLKSNKNISYSQYKKLKFEPPVTDDNYKFKTLQKDLNDYEKYMDYLIYKKKPKIVSLLNKIVLIIKEIDPDYEIKVFGSYAYGLSLPWSNLNLILVNKNKNLSNKTGENAREDNLADVETTVGEKSVKSETQSDNLSHTNINNNNYKDINNNNNDDVEKTDLLVKLILYFRNFNWIKKSNINQIEDINLISLITNEEYDKIEVNISMESKNHNGLKVVELIKSYIKEYSVLKPLYFALRTLLKNANLHIASSGGLCAYGLILMLVSFIQSQRDNNKTDNEYIIGKTFFEFLLHYGIKFDFNKYVILTYKINETNTSTNEKDVYNAGQNAKEFMIVDPLNDNNNVAKSTFQFMNIKMALLIAFMVIKEDCDCGCHYGKAFYENNFNSIEHSYLKRIFNSVKRFTEPEK